MAANLTGEFRLQIGNPHVIAPATGIDHNGMWPWKQANAFAVPLDDQSIAIMFDLVDPIFPVGTVVPRVGRKGSNAVLRMSEG